MKILPSQRTKMISRLRAGESKVQEEARRYRISERQVRRLLEEAGGKEPGPETETPEENAKSETAQTSGKPPESPKIEEALRDVGELNPAASHLPPAVDARAEDEKLALETVQGTKSAAVTIAGSMLLAIPDSDPILARSSQLTSFGKAAVIANAPWLADQIRKNVGGPYLLAVMLGLDVLVTVVSLLRYSAKIHPKKPPVPVDPAKEAAPA